MNKQTPYIISCLPWYDLMQVYIDDSYGEEDMGWTRETCSIMAARILKYLMPTIQTNDTEQYFLEELTLFVDQEYAIGWLNYVKQSLIQICNHMQIPMYCNPGYEHEIVPMSDCTVNVFVKLYRHPPTDIPLTREDIIHHIQQGDYISDKLKRQFGL